MSFIKETDRNQPFEVVFVEHPVTDDMKDDGTPVIKVYDYKAAFDPSVKTPDGVNLHQLKAAMMSVCSAYTDCLPLKAAKVKDVKALSEHVVLPPSVTFYRNLKGDDGVEDDVEEFETTRLF